MTTPSTEEDSLFRGVLACTTVAVGDKEAVQMGVSLGLPELLKGLSSGTEKSDRLKSVVGDALAVFKS